LSPRKNLKGLSRTFLTLILVLIIAFAGVALYVTLSPPNSSTTTHSSTQSSSGGSNLTIALNPTIPLIAPGQTQNYSSIKIAGGAPNGTLVLAVKAPPGLSFFLNKTSVSLSSNPQSIPFVLKATPSLSVGKYAVTIEASSPGVPAESKNLSVEVVPALVVLQALVFHPQNITVPKGTNVTWINLDSNIGCCDPGVHTVVFLSGANASSSQLKLFDTWSYQFNAAGEVNYFCSIHPYMKGNVKVTG
jgi:plastocyanin